MKANEGEEDGTRKKEEGEREVKGKTGNEAQGGNSDRCSAFLSKRKVNYILHETNANGAVFSMQGKLKTGLQATRRQK